MVFTLPRFLDVLAARKDPAGLLGEVLVDGAPQPPNFKCLSGYVVQVPDSWFSLEKKPKLHHYIFIILILLMAVYISISTVVVL